MATDDLPCRDCDHSSALDKRLDRLEDKLDRYADRLSTEVAAIGARLTPVERDVAVAKKIAALSLGGAATLAWDGIKKKLGIG